MAPLLDRLFDVPAERLAFVPGAERGRPVSYTALDAASRRIAHELLARTTGGRTSLEGARVGLLMPPGAPFAAALLGIWRAGGAAVPLSPLHPAREIAHMLSVATPACVVAAAEHQATLDEAVASARGSQPAPEQPPPAPAEPARLAGDWVEAAVREASEREGPGGAERSDGGAFGAASAAPWARGDAMAPAPSGDATALVLFTSGTTGKPKGVCLSHAGVAATLRCLETAWRWSADDRLLHLLPLHHTHGLIVALLGALWARASVRFESFEAERTWSSLADVTVFMAVPTIYVRLIEALRTAEPARRAAWTDGARALRLATSGSAALPASVMTAFAEATGQVILERYGMTEIGMALGNPYDGPRLPGSVGFPLPEVHVDVVGDDERSVPSGVPGELRVRTPQMFAGYDGDPTATAASFDDAGRFRTGDTGVVDDDGRVRLLGRTSVDVLKSGGYKISALEIEDVLRLHPNVADVAVVGIPDPVWGDCITACVVAREGEPITLDDLQSWARRELAPYKLPRALKLMNALPRNALGKVQKSQLR